MIAALVLVLLGQAEQGPGLDGGAWQASELTVDSLYTACPDAPFAEAIDGGYFVPEARQRRQNCKLAACEDYVAPKLREESGPPSPGIVLGITGTGIAIFIIGILLGYFAHGK